MRPVRNGWLMLSAGLLLAGPARASTMGAELGGTAGQATEVSSGAGTVLVRGVGDVDLSEQVSLHLDFAYTRALAQAPPPGLTVGSSGGNVFTLAAGVDLAVMETALLSFDLNYSPSSTVQQQVSVPLGAATLHPLVSSESQAFGGTLAFGYSTGFEHDLEVAVDGALTVTRFDSEQQIVNGSGNPLPPETCATVRPALRSLCALLLAEHGTAFTESRIAAGATLTLFRDTDAALSGAYYVYSNDPTEVGYFALATGGRLPTTLGDPIQLIPLLWSIRPGITHRFGEAVSLGVYYEFGDGYSTEGTTQLLGFRLAVRVSREVRLILRAEGQSFTDGAGVTALSGSLVLTTRVEL
ncbi:MAG TPA: hypothetical protein VEJ89_16400 [Myxococcaceae bacterium]|nr:hypothetical protein [Myxococcaceae bacterium]